MLIDIGNLHSFISPKFVYKIEKRPTLQSCRLAILTLSGEMLCSCSVILDWEVKDCRLDFGSYVLVVDL